MLVKEILAKKRARIITVLPEETMRDAVQAMAAEKIGSILVVDGDGVLKGIFSERDLIRIIANDAAEARDYPVGQVATTSVVSCTEESTLEDLLTLMSDNTIRHVPVLRDGKLVGMVSARDLMDAQKDDLIAALDRQRQASALMTRARDHAEQANRMKTEFLRRMSHELRTPLNSIIGFSDLIKSQKLGKIGNADYVEYAGEINTSGNHLLALIDDILSVTRLESGKHEMTDIPLDPVELVGACLTRFNGAADHKNISIETNFSADAVRLTGDEEMFSRMLDNLVSNAIKFTPDGGSVCVDVRLDRDADLLVSVADTGIGISPEDLQAVLVPFSQIESVLDRRFEGTGLGLALVKMMVEMHEGELGLESDLGSGTNITLRFPEFRVDVAAKPQAAAI